MRPVSQRNSRLTVHTAPLPVCARMQLCAHVRAQMGKGALRMPAFSCQHQMRPFPHVLLLLFLSPSLLGFWSTCACQHSLHLRKMCRARLTFFYKSLFVPLPAYWVMKAQESLPPCKRVGRVSCTDDTQVAQGIKRKMKEK